MASRFSVQEQMRQFSKNEQRMTELGNHDNFGPEYVSLYITNARIQRNLGERSVAVAKLVDKVGRLTFSDFNLPDDLVIDQSVGYGQGVNDTLARVRQILIGD